MPNTKQSWHNKSYYSLRFTSSKLEGIKNKRTFNVLKIENMTEETKKQLMQYVHKLAAHYEIPNAELVSFKKRTVVLELLSGKAPDAHKAVSDLIDASLKLERIQNDKEKQAKKPDHWNEEVGAAQDNVSKALERLIAFMKNENIH